MVGDRGLLAPRVRGPLHLHPTAAGTINVNVTSGITPLPSPLVMLVGGGGGGGGGGTRERRRSRRRATAPTAGTPITITAAATGGSGSYTAYLWDTGDGGSPVSLPYASINKTYGTVGVYYVHCTVTDSLGASGTGNRTINVQAPAGPTNVMAPTSGASPCTFGGCSTPYTGTTGTAITVGIFQGSVQQWEATTGP